MKVAIYSGSIPSTTFIERLIVGLAERGIEIILHGQKNESVLYNSEKIRVIGYSGPFSKLWLFISYFLAFLIIKPQGLKQLINIFRETNSSRSFVNYFIRTAPIIWHEPDIFHLQWAKGVEDWILVKKFGIKFLLSLRGTHIHYSPIVDKNLAKKYSKLFPSIDAFHGVSKMICREGAKYGADWDKCGVVYSGLNLSEFSFRPEKSFDRKRIKIISVGRSHWIKGYNFALDAMQILKERGIEFRYTVIGGKDEELIYQVADLKLENYVSLEGKMPFEKVKSLVAEADVLLLPSVEEGIPNVVLEAMALGTVAVSTDCGGVSEVLRDGENGFTVPIRCPQAIASRIESLLGLSDKELNVIRQNARKTVENQHNHQKMIEDMIALYQSVQ